VPQEVRSDAPVTSVAYCPNAQRTLILVSCESNMVYVLNAECGDKLEVSSSDQFLAALEPSAEPINGVKWTLRDTDKRGASTKKTTTVQLTMNDKIRSVTWHRKGDYFATVGFESSASTVLIHQLSKCTTQKPFSKKKGTITAVLFHPTQPLFFVATQQHVRIYDLAKCELKRKLHTGSKWISCMHMHPAGNNLFIGGLDRAFSWLDMELSAKPWKSLKNHASAIRSICYHNRYPLLATASDDATAIVYHAKVSTDLMRDNELVPVKRLYGHKMQAQKDGKDSSDLDKQSAGAKLAILSATFHPTQAWLLTGGADGRIALFSY